MGREIRRAPGDWQHPKYSPDEARLDWQRDAYHPLYDRTFAEAMEEWYQGWKRWEAGERDKDADPDCTYWDWCGSPPDPAYYRRRAWTKEEATHLAVYETVSEGTPVTPFFATPEELIDYLVAHGDFWDQNRKKGGWPRTNAEAFVKSGWAPSLIAQNGVVRQGARDGC